MGVVRIQSNTPRRGQVYLLRGWQGLWSQGIDDLTKELTADGIDAHIFYQGQTGELGDTLLSRYRELPNGAEPDPLVLIGFSYGADEAINLARKLETGGKTVDLVILMDPVTPASIPRNILSCQNFYQSNGIWDAFPWLRGIPVEAEAKDGPDAARVVNTNIRDREDLLEPNTGHSTIAGNAKLHRVILEQVRRVCPPRNAQVSK